jgi:hypothetical protein
MGLVHRERQVHQCATPDSAACARQKASGTSPDPSWGWFTLALPTRYGMDWKSVGKPGILIDPLLTPHGVGSPVAKSGTWCVRPIPNERERLNFGQFCLRSHRVAAQSLTVAS